MTLDQYLASEGISAAEFSTRCDPPISTPTISRIRRGNQNISSDTMIAIIRASKGKITANDLLAVRAS